MVVLTGNLTSPTIEDVVTTITELKIKLNKINTKTQVSEYNTTLALIGVNE